MINDLMNVLNDVSFSLKKYEFKFLYNAPVPKGIFS